MSAVPDVSDALSLLSTHPNELSSAVHTLAPAFDLIHAYSTGRFSPAIPPGIRSLIDSIRTVQLPRTPIALPNVPTLPSTQGMSPKKTHEVQRMAAYIVSLASHLPQDKPVHIVDIGAGQGYLTRALKALLPSSHILALDADTDQTRGAQRWEHRLLPHADPPIAHRVIFISPDSLLSTLDEWAGTTGDGANPVPVLFVALHACGSLTPDILRAYIRAAQHPLHHPKWYPAALVAVGCCYNLMNPSDYPKSTQHLPISAYHLAAQIPGTWLLSTDPPVLDPSVELAIRKVTWRALLGKALENATPVSPLIPPSSPPAAIPPPNKSATVPARWSRRPLPPSSPNPNPQLNPLLNPSLQPSSPQSGIGYTPNLLRLGRLRDSAYTSWNTFLQCAGEKMGVVFHPDDYEDENESEGEEGETCQRKPRKRGRDISLENDLAVLHILRCLLGPVIESAILRDRVAWVRDGLGLDPDPALDLRLGAGLDLPLQVDEETRTTRPEMRQETRDARVELVNLFDQSTGSGRNVAIVIAPQRCFDGFESELG